MKHIIQNLDSLIKKLPSWAIITLIAMWLFTGLDPLGFFERNQARDDSFAALYRAEISHHKETIDELAKKERDYSKLKAQLMVLNGDIIDIPYPFWLKNDQSVVLYVNEAYVEKILKPSGVEKDDFLLTRGEPLVGEGVKAFIENDNIVLLSSQTIVVEESVGDRIGKSHKWLIKDRGITYLCGMWIEDI
ncbi:MAG: hypothetical protein AAGI23_09470 [Bacteroidota bacterium]